MKRFLSIAILTIAVTSCQRATETKIDSTPKEEPSTNEKTQRVTSLGQFPYNKELDQMVVVQIDGCEYIVLNSFSFKEPALTHKGNCKYCMERQELLIQKYAGKFIKDTIH